MILYHPHHPNQTPSKGGLPVLQDLHPSIHPFIHSLRNEEEQIFAQARHCAINDFPVFSDIVVFFQLFGFYVAAASRSIDRKSVCERERESLC